MEAVAGAPPPFHLAFPVRDIAEARQFYGDVLGCPEGRWVPGCSVNAAASMH